ncbi:MAG: M1 family metallopeptidase [Bacteroidia bacterium]|nr:M1 family metallopeptidase [Bacteroidia bacterium]
MKKNITILFLLAVASMAQAPYRETTPKVNDLIHTRLEVSFDWANARLNGKAQLVLKPHFYPTDICYLNARGMEIKNVSVSIPMLDKNKKNISKTFSPSFVYENDSLKIPLGQSLPSTQYYTVNVEYVAKPNELKTGGSAAIRSDKGLYFINPSGANPYKMPQIWTQGETQSNSVWFPTIDSPNEKTTQEIFITVDKKYTTLSNGVLVRSTLNPNGTRTDYWKMDLPHSPYLFMMAVGEFVKITDSPWKGKEISYYVEKDYEKYAKQYFANTKEMIEFYSKILSFEYPWPKYAQVVVRDYVSGAMENTSATLHGDFMIYAGARDLLEQNKGEAVIAHELFHQWFGDVVTCESWSNLPLNESFATYGEYLWYEYKFGKDAAAHHHLKSRKGYMAQDKQVPLIRYHYENREEMFDGFSYNKGGQILHMLRHAVGDDAFFKSLNVYLNNRKFRTAEIHDLRLAFEEVTGKDMNWFFNQWFFEKGHPVLEVKHEYKPNEKKIYLYVEQKQDSAYPTYRLPVDVEYYINNKNFTKRIEIAKRKQTFVFDATAAPDALVFDPDGVLLAEINHEKSAKEWAYQYLNSKPYFARSNALSFILDNLKNTELHDAYWASLNDAHASLRNRALYKLQDMKEKYPERCKASLLKAFENDPDYSNRGDALELLLKLFPGKEADEWCQKAWSMGGTTLVNNVLKHYSNENLEKAYTLAKSIEKEEDSKSVLVNIANVYAKKAEAKDAEFFKSKFKYFSDLELASFLSAYSNFGKKIKDPSVAKKVAEDFAVFYKDGGMYSRGMANMALKSMANAWKANEEIYSHINSIIK